jgi:hypothetical protein
MISRSSTPAIGVSHDGNHFTPATVLQVCEQSGGKLASDVGESVAVEEQKWRAAVAAQKEI